MFDHTQSHEVIDARAIARLAFVDNHDQARATPAALITGATAGIGRALAYEMASKGHNLLLTGRAQDTLEALADDLRKRCGVRVEVIRKDLAQPSAAQDIFEAARKHGLEIEILVNNAGLGFQGPLVSADLDEQLRVLQVNAMALLQLTRLFLPAMVARGEARIMNVSSTAAFGSSPRMSVYSATKAFVLMFSRAIADELVGSGVTVTVLCPGPTFTEFHRRAGIESTRWFERNAMDPQTVARLGYRAMMDGKRIEIPGFANRARVRGWWVSPRGAWLAMSKRLKLRSTAHD
jgi:short-subunit dehydrogenase